MPVSEYFKGSGEKVMKSMQKRYGAKEGKSAFYGVAHKQGLTPGGKAGKPKSKPGKRLSFGFGK